MRSELHLRDGLAPWLEQRDIARAQGALDAGVQGSQRVSDARVQGPHCATHSMTPGCCGKAALILLKQSLNGAHVTWHWHTLHSVMVEQSTAGLYTCMASETRYGADRAAISGRMPASRHIRWGPVTQE